MSKNVPAKKEDTQENYAIATIQDPAEISNIIRENLGGLNISVRMLPNLHVPGGGGTSWEMPTVDGTLSLPEITGIIIATQPIRRFYRKSFNETGGGTPPDCYSPDGVNGYGDPGGNCMGCPNNRFIPGTDGVPTKPCSERQLIFMVMKDDILPVVVHAPVKSLANIQHYLINLTRVRKQIYSVYTTLSLERDKSQKGIAYSKIVPRRSGEVPPEQLPAVEAYAKAIKPFLVQTITEIAQSTAENSNGTA